MSLAWQYKVVSSISHKLLKRQTVDLVFLLNVPPALWALDDWKCGWGYMVHWQYRCSAVLSQTRGFHSGGLLLQQGCLWGPRDGNGSHPVPSPIPSLLLPDENLEPSQGCPAMVLPHFLLVIIVSLFRLLCHFSFRVLSPCNCYFSVLPISPMQSTVGLLLPVVSSHQLDVHKMFIKRHFTWEILQMRERAWRPPLLQSKHRFREQHSEGKDTTQFLNFPPISHSLTS